MTEVRKWTAARSGAAITVKGTADDGHFIIISEVRQIEPDPARAGRCLARRRTGEVVSLIN